MATVTLPNAEQVERIIDLMGGDEDVYGVHWNQEIDELERVRGARNLVQNDFNKVFPWAGINRCNLNDSGQVVAYHGDPNYREDGLLGNEDDGFTLGHQVMVEIPKFYYRGFKTTKGKQWEVSPNKKSGFKLHPAFTDGVKEFDNIYMSAFEGTLYDVSASKYLKADEQIADFAKTSGDKLSSVAGGRPASGETQNLTIVNSRILAENRGEGWGQQDFTTVSAIQLLLIIEYASFDSQSVIGKGVVDKTSGTGNESEVTGGTASLGNASGMASGTDGLVSVSYRGIENFWGNIYKWVDGLNIKADNQPYLAKGEYISDKYDSQFEYLGGTLAKSNGYTKDLLMNDEFDFGFLATDSKGSSSNGLHDYYYQAVGNRVALLGGDWSYGLTAGAFCLGLYYAASNRYRIIGARLLCKI